MGYLHYKADPVCQQCGKDLFGRSDKKYCNDTCRNRANSKRRRHQKWDEPKHVYQISRDLLRNRQIIAGMGTWTNEPKVTTRGELLDKGFNFEYHTNILETKKGRYHYCYEYGWMELENGKILLVMTERYLDITVRISGEKDWK